MSQVTIDNILELLNETRSLGAISASAKYELVGGIDPLSPNLTASERLLVLRACKRSKPFLLWLLRQLITTEPAAPKDVLWGTASVLAAKSGPLSVMLNELLARAYPILRGKPLEVTCWLFESGHLCLVATFGNNGRTYKHVTKVSTEAMERVGAKFKPAGIRAEHIAGLFDRSWVGYLSDD